nr:uncharacterized protein LOC119715363 [Anas platyrhynchos]
MDGQGAVGWGHGGGTWGHGDGDTGWDVGTGCGAAVGSVGRGWRKRLRALHSWGGRGGPGCFAWVAVTQLRPLGPPGRPGNAPHTHGCPWPEPGVQRGLGDTAVTAAPAPPHPPRPLLPPSPIPQPHRCPAPPADAGPPLDAPVQGAEGDTDLRPPNERVPTVWSINDGISRGTSHLQFTPSSTGRYSFRCWRSWSEPSPPLKLSVSDDWWVLQAPVQPVLEGDELVLRCRSRWDLRPSSVSFFRKGSCCGGRGGRRTRCCSPPRSGTTRPLPLHGRRVLEQFKTKPNEVVCTSSSRCRS